MVVAAGGYVGTLTYSNNNNIIVIMRQVRRKGFDTFLGANR